MAAMMPTTTPPRINDATGQHARYQKYGNYQRYGFSHLDSPFRPVLYFCEQPSAPIPTIH